MCRCLSCNKKLSSREMTRKYVDWKEIPKVEDRYIMLCTTCFTDSTIPLAEINPLLPDNDGEQEYESDSTTDDEGVVDTSTLVYTQEEIEIG